MNITDKEFVELNDRVVRMSDEEKMNVENIEDAKRWREITINGTDSRCNVTGKMHHLFFIQDKDKYIAHCYDCKETFNIPWSKERILYEKIGILSDDNYDGVMAYFEEYGFDEIYSIDEYIDQYKKEYRHEISEYVKVYDSGELLKLLKLINKINNINGIIFEYLQDNLPIEHLIEFNKIAMKVAYEIYAKHVPKIIQFYKNYKPIDESEEDDESPRVRNFEEELEGFRKAGLKV